MEQASSPDDVLFQRAMEFERQAKYREARELLTQLHERTPDDVRVVQRLARNTYRDEDLLPRMRFRRALELLRSIGLEDRDAAVARGVSMDSFPETYGLGGAIYKRMWEISGQLEPLQRSLQFYREGWLLSPNAAGAWCGVNTIFALEALASRERVAIARARPSATTRPKTPELIRIETELAELRGRLKAELEKQIATAPDETDHWTYATLAEVEFGLNEWNRVESNLDKARRVTSRSDGSPTFTPAQIQVTFKQLVRLGRLRGLPTPSLDALTASAWTPWRALKPLLAETPGEVADDKDLAAALNCARGRVGLALSGGGFRASLFHIGVLARLADVDALRSVEALSTVSGGSIVGAHYYLEVRHLLETKSDCDITRQDYVDIVRRVQERFLSGVQRNLRTHVLSSWPATIKMLVSSGRYTRSSRIGELYQEHLFARIGPQSVRPKSLRMQDLTITPKPGRAPNCDAPSATFNIKADNWRRAARVPMLLLNATSLNSGHAWQFTARSMGEPPGLVDEEVGANPRHRRLHYEKAPLVKRWPWSAPSSDLQDVSLGQAVAASACVPGLFEPLELNGLYPGRTVRLVDGGVFDNQGVRTLIDQGFSLILCSDASGQMDEDPKPGAGALAVPLRSFGIVTSRVREAEYANLDAAVESRALQGACFIHLRKGLDAHALDWIGCQDPSKPLDRPVGSTEYGVDKGLQRQLSAIRTDLDSFGEVEAFALMLSGYRMMERELTSLQAKRHADGRPGNWGDFDINAKRGDWSFLDAELLRIMSLPADSSDLRRAALSRQLSAGASLVGKLWLVSPLLNRATTALGGVALAAGAIWLWSNRHATTPEINLGTFTYGAVVISIGFTLAAMAVPLFRWLRPTKAGQAFLLKVLFATVGWLAALFHLAVIDPLYLRLTRLERLKRLG